MSDYIRKDDVLALLEKYRIELPSTYSVGLTTSKNAVKGMPTADVVQRAEIAREILEAIKKKALGVCVYKLCYPPKTMIEIFEEDLIKIIQEVTEE